MQMPWSQVMRKMALERLESTKDQDDDDLIQGEDDKINFVPDSQKIHEHKKARGNVIHIAI
jgi:hypothetical protein